MASKHTMENLKTISQLKVKQGAEKRHLFKNMQKNKMFGNLKETYWITKVPLSDQREKNVASCFQKHVHFNISKL